MRLWRSDGPTLRLAAGADPGWSLARPVRPGLSPTPGGAGLARAGDRCARACGWRWPDEDRGRSAAAQRPGAVAGGCVARVGAAARLRGGGAGGPLRGDRAALRDQRDPGPHRPAGRGGPDHRAGSERGGRGAPGFDHGVRRSQRHPPHRRGARLHPGRVGPGAGGGRLLDRGAGSSASGERSPSIRRIRIRFHPNAAEHRGYRGNSFLSVPIYLCHARYRDSMRRGHEPDRPNRG